MSDKPYAASTLGARTMEGLVIYLQVAVHYKLTTVTDDNGKAQQLASIYSMFGKSWATFLASIAEAGIKNVVSNHGFEEFYKQREAIEAEMATLLAPEFALYYMKLTGVFLLNIAFPLALETAVQSTENTQQFIQKYLKLQAKAEIQRDTQISLANMTSTILKSQADAQKNATTIQKAGQLSSIQYVWNQYFAVLKQLEVNILHYVFVGCCWCRLSQDNCAAVHVAKNT